jgi:hypothetical protein
MEALLILAIVAGFTAVAGARGRDSRDGDDWIIHRPL